MEEMRTTSTGISDESRTLAAVGYIIWIVALVAYFIKPEDKYLRFHALQEILLGIVEIAIILGLGFIFAILAFIPFIGWVIGLLGLFMWPILLLAYIALAVILAIWAYQGKKTKLPLIGNLAEQHA